MSTGTALTKQRDPVKLDSEELKIRRQLEDQQVETQEALETERRLRRLERRASGMGGKARPRTHLLIGDGHAKPGVPNDRFTWLGRMVLELRPDVVINMGDGHDMPSLCFYENYVHSTYKADLEAGKDAYKRVREPTLEFNRGRGRYRPLWIQLGGNHCEGRIAKLLTEKPELHGTVSTRDIQVPGWQYVPWLKPICIDGITYQHQFNSPGSRRAITGVHPARLVLVRKHKSVAFGHNHRFGQAQEGHIMAINCGWYGGADEHYAGEDNIDLWWKGIVVIHDVEWGLGDIEQWSVERIKRRWS
jgi:hypothetical protein